MSATIKPITLYSHKPGPNPWKVVIFLNELNIPYTNIVLKFGDEPGGVKHPDFLKINPNGRVPAIIDPNNDDMIVWESGAILQYLQKRYDPKNLFGPLNEKEEVDILTWLFFQVSGQGPYQGQATWFFKLQQGPKVAVAIERYTNETRRLYKVIDERLNGRKFFIGDHFTVVDAAFYPWTRVFSYAGYELGVDVKNEFPNVWRWFLEMNERPAIIKTNTEKDKIENNTCTTYSSQ